MLFAEKWVVWPIVYYIKQNKSDLDKYGTFSPMWNWADGDENKRDVEREKGGW
jgi:hypothetical protein